MSAKKNPAASVKQRLLNVGKKSGENSDDRLGAVFRGLCAGESGDDGLAFDADSVAVEAIREADEYGGRRVTFAVTLGPARVALQVDIGFGDAVTPPAEFVEYPSLLGIESPKLRAYPKETAVAEKVEAMVKLGLANTRMKDFYDVQLLARTFPFQGEQLRAAIAATFARRGTPQPTETPVALTEAFASDDRKGKQWKAFVKRSGLETRVGELSGVVAELSLFLLPPLLAASKREAFGSSWQAPGPWS